MIRYRNVAAFVGALVWAVGAPAARAYDQRNIRPWEGLYGVTGGYSHNGVLTVYSQDKFWIWSPGAGWVNKGFLGEVWRDAPLVDLNAPGNTDARLRKRPQDYPGVTAAFFKDHANDLHVVSRNRYWRYDFGANRWVGAGFVRDLFPGAPAVGGQLPWDGPGVTGSWNWNNVVTLISKDRYYMYDLNQRRWIGSGFLSAAWAGAPSVDGVKPWQGSGVTGSYIFRWSATNVTLTIISVDKYWVYDLIQNRWAGSGLLSQAWANAPGIDAGWAHPIANDNVADWQITNPLGGCPAFGCGHLGEDWWRRAGNNSSVGQEISAAAQGKVVTVLPTCGNYYNVVILEHMVPDINDADAPLYSFYGHITATAGLREGDWVRRGQVIGTLPNPQPTYGFGAHVHFEVKNWFALTNAPLSNCTNAGAGRYISAGYSGSAFTPGDHYDLPVRPGDMHVRRYYKPSRFVELRGGGPAPGR